MTYRKIDKQRIIVEKQIWNIKMVTKGHELNNDIMNLITGYLSNSDIFCLLNVNKHFYNNRNNYVIRKINYQYIDKAKYFDIRGLNIIDLDNEIMCALNTNKRIEELVIENLCENNLFELPNNIKKIILNLTSYVKKIELPINLKYIKMDARNIQIDFSNCQNIENIILDINKNTKLNLPKYDIKKFKIKINKERILKNLQFKEKVTCIKWSVNQKCDEDIPDFCTLLDDYTNLRNLNVDCTYNPKIHQCLDLGSIGNDIKNLNLRINIIQLNVPVNIILPNFVEKLTLKLLNGIDTKSNIIVIIKNFPYNIKYLDCHSHNNIRIYLDDYVEMREMEYLKFTNNQIKFKVRNVETLYLNKICLPDLNCYEKINSLYINDTKHIILSDKLKINKLHTDNKNFYIDDNKLKKNNKIEK